MSALQPGLLLRLHVRHSRVLASFLGTCVGFLSTCSYALVQLIFQHNVDISSLQIVLLAHGILLVLAVLEMARQRIHPFGKDYHFHAFFVAMGVSCLLNTTFSYEALNRIPVADFTTLCLVRPVLTYLLCFLVGREHCSWMEAICGAMSCVGVLIACRPSFLFGGSDLDIQAIHASNSTVFKSSAASNGRQRFEGICLTFSAALMSSSFYVFSRQVGKVSQHTVISVFYTSIVACVAIPLAMFVKSEPFITDLSADVLIMLGWVSFTAYSKLMLIPEAVQLENATHCMLVRNVDIVYAVILQFLFFGSLPSWYTLIGAWIAALSSGTMTWLRRQSDTWDED